MFSPGVCRKDSLIVLWIFSTVLQSLTERLTVECDWFLPLDPANHIKLLLSRLGSVP